MPKTSLDNNKKETTALIRHDVANESKINIHFTYRDNNIYLYNLEKKIRNLETPQSHISASTIS